MSRRLLKILVAIIIVLILALGGFYIFTIYYGQKKVAPAVNQAPTVNLNTPSNLNAVAVNNNTNQPAPVNTEQVNIVGLATIFAQNFGSYSNQSNYRNFNDIYPFMTDSVKNWVTNTYIKSLMTKYPAATYYAIETKVLSSKIGNLDEAKADITLKTQRREFKDSTTASTTFNQDLLLNLVKINNAWKVDGVYWK